MIKAHRITGENVERLRAIYARFCEKAKSHYRWAHDPVPFDLFAEAIPQKILEGYWVEDTSQGGPEGGEPAGFMLYRLEDHRAIEINVVYSELEDKKTILDRLMRQFIADIRDTEGWDVVSWAMLGDQEGFIRTVTWYGFKPVGQAILNFHILEPQNYNVDPITVQIWKQQQLPALPENYVIESWKPEYAGAVAECVYEAFKDAADALWDPRFRSLMGAKKVVAMITGGMMGTHLAECTTVALKDGVPIGFCFLVQSDMMMGNLPLIGVKPGKKRLGLGAHLLKGMIDRAIDHMMQGKMAMLAISTTTDTDNIPAIKMYRRMGFREEYNYPHVYLTREKARAYQPGVWC